MLVYVECGELPVIANGSLSAKSKGAGTEATVSCNLPYAVQGSLTYRCNEQGIWSGNGRCGE